MASVLKARRIANPGKRRKLSAKQIKFFGTKRQRAALARRRVNPSIRKVLKARKRDYRDILSGAGHSKRSQRKLAIKGYRPMARRLRMAARQKNIGAIYTVTLGGNPGKKENKSMARRRTRRHRNPSVRRRRRTVARNPRYIKRVKRGRYLYGNPRRRRRNPGVRSYRRRRHAIRRHRNPGISMGMGNFSKMAKTALYIIAGAVATRSLTQMVLRDKNQGAMGYVANAIGAFILGFAASKVLKNQELGTQLTVGGMTGLALRVLQEQTPIGQYVNLQLSGMGMLGDVGMGAIVPTTFFVPLYHAPGGENIANTQLPAAVRAMAAPAASGMRGVGAVVAGGRYTKTGRYSR